MSTVGGKTSLKSQSKKICLISVQTYTTESKELLMPVLGIQSESLMFAVNSYEITGLLDLICFVYTQSKKENRAALISIQPRMASIEITKPKDMERYWVACVSTGCVCARKGGGGGLLYLD